MLGDVERRLEGREWIACADFTVADVMLACVLRGVRKTDLMEPFPSVKAYYEPARRGSVRSRSVPSDSALSVDAIR